MPVSRRYCRFANLSLRARRMDTAREATARAYLGPDLSGGHNAH